jgi:membrane associated rhomboid family serine protease
MKHLWNRFLGSLTPGVRVLLTILSVLSVTAIVGRIIHFALLDQWLPVSGPLFWSGQLWRVVTYVLLPVGVPDFLINGLMIAMLGGSLERVWSRKEFWIYCAVAAVGGGLAKVTLQHSFPVPLMGGGPLVYGLLAAWACLFGHERASFAIFGKMTIRQMVLLGAAVSFVMSWFSAGLTNALIMVSGGLAGWGYIWLRTKLVMGQESRTVNSERISRLEL